jgi:hypothetical protein
MLRLPQSDWQCGLEILEMKERLIAKASYRTLTFKSLSRRWAAVVI